MKIKPEDLKNYIGEKIVHPNYRFVVTLLAVGDKKIFVQDACREEGTYYISEYFWETYEEPKKKVKLEEWIYKDTDGTYHVYGELRDSKRPLDEVYDFGKPIKCIATYEFEE